MQGLGEIQAPMDMQSRFEQEIAADTEAEAIMSFDTGE